MLSMFWSAKESTTRLLVRWLLPFTASYEQVLTPMLFCHWFRTELGNCNVYSRRLGSTLSCRRGTSMIPSPHFCKLPTALITELICWLDCAVSRRKHLSVPLTCRLRARLCASSVRRI